MRNAHTISTKPAKNNDIQAIWFSSETPAGSSSLLRFADDSLRRSLVNRAGQAGMPSKSGGHTDIAPAAIARIAATELQQFGSQDLRRTPVVFPSAGINTDLGRRAGASSRPVAIAPLPEPSRAGALRSGKP